MDSVDATQLKNRLGEALRRAALGPLAIVRHGRVVAHLVPPAASAAHVTRRRSTGVRKWTRREEERLVELCAQADFRPSRWLRAGDARMFAGVAAMLASHERFDRTRMLALAERLDPGISAPGRFGQWLAGSPILAARFLPMLDARMQQDRARSPAAAPRT